MGFGYFNNYRVQITDKIRKIPMIEFSSNSLQRRRNTQKRITFYAPESQLRHPIALFKRMYWDLLASRDLAWRLFVRDISAQYR